MVADWKRGRDVIFFFAAESHEFQIEFNSCRLFTVLNLFFSERDGLDNIEPYTISGIY
jgi:hypothetical protein